MHHWPHFKLRTRTMTRQIALVHAIIDAALGLCLSAAIGFEGTRRNLPSACRELPWLSSHRRSSNPTWNNRPTIRPRVRPQVRPQTFFGPNDRGLGFMRSRLWSFLGYVGQFPSECLESSARAASSKESRQPATTLAAGRRIARKAHKASEPCSASHDRVKASSWPSAIPPECILPFSRSS